MIKIVIKDAAVTERSGTKNGRQWHMRTQVAWAQLQSKPYPVEIQITLSDQQPAFAVGEYSLGADTAWVTKYGEIRLDLAKMKPMAGVSAAGRAA